MGYYTTTDPNDLLYINSHYIVSDELIKILSKLSQEELDKALIICEHHYHTESDKIISVDTKKNEIKAITNYRRCTLLYWKCF